MQYQNPTAHRFIRMASACLCAGAIAASLALGLGGTPCLASAGVAVEETTEVGRWSEGVWNAARSGDMTAVEQALRAVPDSRAASEVQRLRDLIASRSQHADDDSKARDADRASARTEITESLAKGEISKALTAAVKLQTLSENFEAALQLAEMREVMEKAEVAQAAAEASGDWLLAQEILFRLRTLHDESDGETFRRYDAKLDEVNKRITLLAQYAPRELWRLRKTYAEKVDPSKPFPEFNEAFANDWREQLDGISKGMLTTALTTAANDHISAGGWEPLVRGGLDAVRVLATTPTLRENFEGLADPDKAKMLAEEAVRAIEDLARMNRDAVGKPQYNSALRSILAANAAGPMLPEPVIYREFGDGALEELSRRFEDEYSQVIWPDQLRRFNQMIQGNFVGVGIMIRHDDRRDIQVVNPLEGSPAARGGVKSEDRIVAVDGKSTVGWTLNKAVDSITGPAGERVSLTVKRDGVEEPLELSLVREEIKIRSVNGWWKKGLDQRGAPIWDWYIDADSGIGYVRLTSFNEDSFPDFLKAIREMRAERPLHGVILDLRHNPGGLLKSAVEFSNAFVERGGIVAVQDRNGRQVQRWMAEPGRAQFKDLPLVVLINQGSASASEIVSGTLKAHDRAVVIGDRTFGKGSVQTVHPCGDQRSDAQLKLTTQYYVIPPGPGESEPRLVHKRPGSSDWGVNPDLVVKMTPDQIEKSTMLRQNADVIEQKKAKADAEPKARPNVEELVTTGVDPQLELALLVLQARSLKELDAAAQAAAVDSKKSDQSGG